MKKKDLREFLTENLRIDTETGFGGSVYVRLQLKDSISDDNLTSWTTLSESILDIPRCEHD